VSKVLTVGVLDLNNEWNVINLETASTLLQLYEKIQVSSDDPVMQNLYLHTSSGVGLAEVDNPIQ